MRAQLLCTTVMHNYVHSCAEQLSSLFCRSALLHLCAELPCHGGHAVLALSVHCSCTVFALSLHCPFTVFLTVCSSGNRLLDAAELSEPMVNAVKRPAIRCDSHSAQTFLLFS